jgi:hypothetical protein
MLTRLLRGQSKIFILARDKESLNHGSALVRPQGPLGWVVRPHSDAAVFRFVRFPDAVVGNRQYLPVCHLQSLLTGLVGTPPRSTATGGWVNDPENVGES